MIRNCGKTRSPRPPRMAHNDDRISEKPQHPAPHPMLCRVLFVFTAVIVVQDSSTPAAPAR